MSVPWFPRGQAARSRHVAVIGAGIAGASVARSLAERGFHVRVFERHVQVAHEASGNPAGILLPVVSRTDNVLSRLTQLGLQHAQRQLAGLMRTHPEVDWRPSGVLRLARNPRHAAQQTTIAAESALATDFARWVDADEGSALVGMRVEQPGWWFAGGGSLCPPQLVHALLQHPSIELHEGTSVHRLKRRDALWTLHDAQGEPLAQCSDVILANAHDALRLLPALYTEALPIAVIRGQISLAPAQGAWHDLRAVVCREGYVIPPWQGQLCFGASFVHGVTDRHPSVHEHGENLQRLAAMLPHADLPEANALGGRVALRCATPDRLPLLGPLHDAEDFRQRYAKLHLTGRVDGAGEAHTIPGLWLHLAHGARGLVWSGVLGEALACMLAGEAMPLPEDLLYALHPARFDYRMLRIKPEHRTPWRFAADD